MKKELRELAQNFDMRRVEMRTPFDAEKRKYLCKVYSDGGHNVASLYIPLGKKRVVAKPEKKLIDEVFDSLYCQGVKENLSSKKMFVYIKNALVNEYKLAEDNAELDKYITERIKRKLNNFHKLVKRFKRKAYLNKWNYFCTFTYDDKKHSPESFRKKLRRCLSNLATRHGWRYMGVFEYAPETCRIHFHCLMFIPYGHMVGEIFLQKDYSTKLNAMQISHNNTFFAERFGRCDFAPISNTEMTLGYILKYLRKSGERIVYSRKIPSEITMLVDVNDIATDFFDYCMKFVLFDNVITWEKDVMNYRPIQTMFELSA